NAGAPRRCVAVRDRQTRYRHGARGDIKDAKLGSPARAAAAHHDLLPASIDAEILSNDQLRRGQCDVESAGVAVVIGIGCRDVEENRVASVRALNGLAERAWKEI